MRLLIAGALVIAFSPGSVRAHESRPLYVEIEQQEVNAFSVQWKTPPSVPAQNAPVVVLPESCAPVGPMRVFGDVRSQRYVCDEGLAEKIVTIRYPMFNPSVSTLLRISWLSGQSHSALGAPDQTTLQIPGKESFSSVAKQYLVLGIEHILKGYDHLLFLACLLLIAGTTRRILITVTGFTIAHSLTLALSALGLVKVSVAPVEAAIALSIVFLAVEIARDRKDTLTYRYPIAVAASFGLLHGFGFAAVLGEAGLPQTEIPAALLFFNLGVEVGQVAFVLAAIGLFRLIQAAARALTARPVAWPGWERVVAYPVGFVAAFWMFERIAGFFG